MTSVQIFEAVAAGELTPEEGAALLQARGVSRPKLWFFAITEWFMRRVYPFVRPFV